MSQIGSSVAGSSISPAVKESIHPSTVDHGHSCDLVVYSGTLADWNGRTGNIIANSGLGDAAFPKAQPGEYPAVRASAENFDYAPASGDRVRFVIIRDSAGDKIAKAVTRF